MIEKREGQQCSAAGRECILNISKDGDIIVCHISVLTHVRGEKSGVVKGAVWRELETRTALIYVHVHASTLGYHKRKKKTGRIQYPGSIFPHLRGRWSLLSLFPEVKRVIACIVEIMLYSPLKCISGEEISNGAITLVVWLIGIWDHGICLSNGFVR